MARRPHETVARHPTDAFTPGRFALLQALVLLVQYPALIAGSQSLFFRDFGQYGYPNAHFHRECFWEGILPLWNPLSSCGIPFLAQWNTQALYPGSLLYLLLPLPWSLNLFSVVHLFLGGLGMYCLARRWTTSGFAAATAGLAYSINGVAMNAVMWPSIVSALALAPWTVHAVLQTTTRRRPLAPAIALATLQMLTGGVEVILATWLVIGLLTLDHLLAPGSPRLHTLGRLAGIVALVSCLSAPQLLPFSELLGASERSETSTGTFSSLPRSGWANFLVPLFATARTPGGLPFQPGQIWLTSYYLGLATVALALAAPLLRPARRTFLLAAAALLCLLLALGDHGLLYPALHRLLPAIDVLRYPVKFLLPLLLLVPLLATLTLDHLSNLRPTTPRLPARLSLTLLALGALIVVLAIFAPATQQQPELVAATRSNAAVRLALLSLLALALAGIARATTPARLRMFQWAFLAAACLDLLTHAPNQAPTVPRETFLLRLQDHRSMTTPPRPGAGRAMLTPQALALFDRTHLTDSSSSYLGLRLGLYMNCNLLENIPKVDGFYPLQPKYHARLANRLALTQSTPDPLADFLAVTQITATNSVTDWRQRPSPMPLVSGGQAPEPFDDPSALDRLFQPDFNPRHTVLLPPDHAPAFATAQPGTPSIELQAFSPHELRFTCRTDHTNTVVIAQSWFPPWTATIDGQPAPLYRANLAFQALVVPPGDHQVELRYHDRRFLLGLVLSALTAVTLVAAHCRPRPTP